MLGCFLSFVTGVASLGLFALWVLLDLGHNIGWIVGFTHQAWNAGPAAAAAGILLPHAVLEIPAMLLASALGFRAGLAWIRPLPGLRPWVSVRRISRDFAVSLMVIGPFLFIAGILEAYAWPMSFDRFVVLGVGNAPGMSDERRIGGYGESVQAAWSPDGEHLATIGLGGRLWLRELGGGAPDLLLADPGDDASFYSPSWSPDGKRIAFIRDPVDIDDREHYALMVLDVASRKLEIVPGGPVGRYRCAAWAPNAELIAVVIAELSPDLTHSKGTNVWTVDTESEEWQKATAFLPGWPGVAPGSGLSWSPDGRAIAFVKYVPHQGQEGARTITSGRYVLCVAASDGARVKEVTRLRHTTDVAWSPDGNWIAFVESPPSADVSDWTETDIFQAPDLGDIGLIRPDGADRADGLARADQLSSLSWSPDGKRLTYQRLGTCIIGTPRIVASR